MKLWPVKPSEKEGLNYLNSSYVICDVIEAVLAVMSKFVCRRNPDVSAPRWCLPLRGRKTGLSW